MATTLRMTIVYEQGDDGWTIASVPEVPGTHSQGRTRDEARANVIDALETMLTPDEALAAGDVEPLVLTIER
jgi:predicted RNase H-like HicB family nuclease